MLALIAAAKLPAALAMSLAGIGTVVIAVSAFRTSWEPDSPAAPLVERVDLTHQLAPAPPPTALPSCTDTNVRQAAAAGCRAALGPPLRQPSEIPQLAALDKGGCNFGDVDFGAIRENITADVDFHGCNLAGASFRGTLANGSDFSEADLTGANLSGGSFAWASFDNAVLRGVVASPAVFQEATFSGANLTGADLSDAIVPRLQADWQGATCPDGSLADQRSDGTCIGTRGLEDPPTTYSVADGYTAKSTATHP